MVWLVHQLEADEIEDVNDEMLDLLVKREKNLAVLFCESHSSLLPPPLIIFDRKENSLLIFLFPSDDESAASEGVLGELENIDDECDQNDIAFVKIHDNDEAKEHGIDEVPALIYYEDGVPTVYEGESSNGIPLTKPKRSSFLVISSTSWDTSVLLI